MILASNSPRRLQLLQEAGYTPLIHAEDIDESKYVDKDDVFNNLPYAKAIAAIATLEPQPQDEFVVAADTTVWVDDLILGKPSGDQDAFRMLKLLSGRTHNVSTGVAICKIAKDTNKILESNHFVETTKVEFYDLEDEEIWEYINTKEPHDKAGAYGIQGKGRLFVKGIEGDYFNVVGLPIARLTRELKKMNR